MFRVALHLLPIILIGYCSCNIGNDHHPLARIIPSVDLRESINDFAPGGATMREAVFWLRYTAGVAVSFEEVKPVGQLTLSNAVKRLEEAERSGVIGPNDAKRLTEYRARIELIERLKKLQGRRNLTEAERELLKVNAELVKAKEDPQKSVVGPERYAFRFLSDRLPLHAVLDRLVALDPSYEWVNLGTESLPLLVIQPKDKVKSGLLNQTLAMPCETATVSNESRSTDDLRRLLQPEGTIGKQLLESGLSFDRGSREREIPGAPRRQAGLPYVLLTPCLETMTTREVLIATVRSAGNGYFWSALVEDDGRVLLSFDSI